MRNRGKPKTTDANLRDIYAAARARMVAHMALQVAGLLPLDLAEARQVLAMAAAAYGAARPEQEGGSV